MAIFCHFTPSPPSGSNSLNEKNTWRFHNFTHIRKLWSHDLQKVTCRGEYPTYKLRYCLVPEILMTKESCNLIGWEHISVNNLKVYDTWGKGSFVSLELSFWIFFNVVIPPLKQSHSLRSLDKSGHWARLLTPHKQYISSCKKSKILQRYWWPNNPAILLDTSIFWSTSTFYKYMYVVAGQILLF